MTYWLYTLGLRQSRAHFFMKTVFYAPKGTFGAGGGGGRKVIALPIPPSVHQSVRPASCPVHISYILWGRNFKFGVWMHIEIAKCLVIFSGHYGLDLDLVFRIIVSGAYLLYYLRKESQIWYLEESQVWYLDASWDDKASRTILGSLWHWPWPLI